MCFSFGMGNSVRISWETMADPANEQVRRKDFDFRTDYDLGRFLDGTEQPDISESLNALDRFVRKENKQIQLAKVLTKSTSVGIIKMNPYPPLGVGYLSPREND